MKKSNLKKLLDSVPSGLYIKPTDGKRRIVNEEGVSEEDYPPIRYEDVAFALFMVTNVVFLLIVGIRIIFNI